MEWFNLDWFKAIGELIGSLAWPLVVVTLVFLFREQLRERMRHLIGAGPTGLTFQAGPQSQALNSLSDTGVEAGTSRSLTNASHPMSTVNRLMGQIRSQLETIPAPEREGQLIRSLAEARVETAFELIFSLIFGSQIMALRELNLKPATHESAREFFQSVAVPLNPDLYQGGTFEQWSKYLIEQGLIVTTPTGYEITEAGRDFLMFVETKKRNVGRVN